jgi:hypothetical protein
LNCSRTTQPSLAADAVVASASSLDDTSASGGFSLRWVLLHLVEETDRHLGHMDVLREQADGRTGEEPTLSATAPTWLPLQGLGAATCGSGPVVRMPAAQGQGRQSQPVDRLAVARRNLSWMLPLSP